MCACAHVLSNTGGMLTVRELIKGRAPWLRTGAPSAKGRRAAVATPGGGGQHCSRARGTQQLKEQTPASVRS